MTHENHATTFRDWEFTSSEDLRNFAELWKLPSNIVLVFENHTPEDIIAQKGMQWSIPQPEHSCVWDVNIGVNEKTQKTIKLTVHC